MVCTREHDSCYDLCYLNPPSSRYRKLALKNHPLKSAEPSSAEIFKQVAEAYDVLSDRE